MDDSWARARAHLALQACDFLWFATIMVVCRARKEWPAYFTLSINELPGQEEGEGNENLPMALTSLISERFLFHDYDEDKRELSSLGDEEAVIIVNPTQYTLETDDFALPPTGGEYSAFDDPDLIEEESLSGRKKLKEQVEAGEHSVDCAEIKAELGLGFRDKAQIAKQAKLAQASQGRQRTSLYQRLFKSGDRRVEAVVSSSDSDEEVVQPLNAS